MTEPGRSGNAPDPYQQAYQPHQDHQDVQPRQGHPTYQAYQGPPPTVPGPLYPAQLHPPPGWAPYPSAAPARPGTLIGAAVVGYINAGLLILAAFMLLAGAALVADVENEGGVSSNSVGLELALMGVLNLLAAALLIAGGVTMSIRRPVGRALYLGGAVLVAVAAVYWLARWGTRDGLGGVAIYAVLFGALTGTGAGLALHGAVGRWLATGP